MKEERQRILKLVEEGKLTVDEALNLLELLEKGAQTIDQKQDEIVHELSTVVHFEESRIVAMSFCEPRSCIGRLSS